MIALRVARAVLSAQRTRYEGQPERADEILARFALAQADRVAELERERDAAWNGAIEAAAQSEEVNGHATNANRIRALKRPAASKVENDAR